MKKLISTITSGFVGFWIQEKMQNVERSILDRIPQYSTFKVMLDKESEIQKDLSWNAVPLVEDDQHYLLGYTSYSSEYYHMIHPVPAGAVVDKLPEGGEEVKIGDQTYVKIGETYYQPVQVDGQNKYEISQVEKD